MRVKQVMSVPATAVLPADSLHVADGIMSMGGVRHLPVVRDGDVVGVVSHRDILRATGLVAPLIDNTRAALKALRVEEVMSSPAVTIDAEASLQAAAGRLLMNRVGCLPVLEAGKLVGIVTTSDLLRAISGPVGLLDSGGSASGRGTPMSPTLAESGA